MLSIVLVISGRGGSTKEITTDTVIQLFKNAGLEAEKPVIQTAEDLDILPFVSSKVVRVTMPSIGEEQGLRIFMFDDKKTVEVAKAYFDELGKASEMFATWTAVNGNVLIQLSGGVKEEDFKKYEAALKKL